MDMYVCMYIVCVCVCVCVCVYMSLCRVYLWVRVDGWVYPTRVYEWIAEFTYILNANS